MYIDESGNFDFSPKGTTFYSLTGIVTHNPNVLVPELNSLRHEILSGKELPKLSPSYLENHLSRKFHASEDRQPVRDMVYQEIQSMPKKIIKAHSIIAQKNKTNPTIRRPTEFYQNLTVPLLKFALKGYQYSELIVFIDSSPVGTKRNALIKNIKTALSDQVPSKIYVIYCVPSESNYLLQVADYINWAIYRKWERNDERSYKLISDLLEKPELDIFERGTTTYYQSDLPA